MELLKSVGQNVFHVLIEDRCGRLHQHHCKCRDEEGYQKYDCHFLSEPADIEYANEGEGNSNRGHLLKEVELGEPDSHYRPRELAESKATPPFTREDAHEIRHVFRIAPVQSRVRCGTDWKIQIYAKGQQEGDRCEQYQLPVFDDGWLAAENGYRHDGGIIQDGHVVACSEAKQDGHQAKLGRAVVIVVSCCRMPMIEYVKNEHKEEGVWRIELCLNCFLPECGTLRQTQCRCDAGKVLTPLWCLALLALDYPENQKIYERAGQSRAEA